MNEPAVSPAAAGAPLAAAGLIVGHGGRALFPPLDLELPPGSLTVLLGRNGAGKTTLLKTLAGLLPPLGGAVRLNGAAATELAGRDRARRIGLLLTDPGLPPFLLGRELVSLGRTPHAPRFAARGEDAETARRVMDELGCAHLADRRLGELSDGERQRLCLARALAQETPALLLDEPLAHLDPPAKAEILGLLRDWAARRGAAVLAAVHEVDLALGFADRCVLLTPGAAPFTGRPEEAAGEPLRRAFPGWPEFWDPLALRRGRATGGSGGYGL